MGAHAQAEQHSHRHGDDVEVAGPAVETWASAVARQHGLAEVNHSIEIFGLCSTCAKESDR